MNIHRTSKKGCEHIINHLKSSCQESFLNIQVIELLKGSGYDEFGDFDKVMLGKRLEREDYWMEKLRTVYPYGLNERKRKLEGCNTIGSMFPAISRQGDRLKRYRGNRNCRSSRNSKNDFIKFFNQQLESNLKESFLTIRKFLDTCKKKTLKEIAVSFRDKSVELQYQNKFDQWYDYVLDIIDTKLFKPSYRSKNQTKKCPKNICTVDFCNKGIELINLNKIFKSKQSVDCLPAKLKQPDFVPIVAYKLLPTIRNKILNYKDAVESIKIDGEVSFSSSGTCECKNSEFCDSHHGHIITGDLRLIGNKKLRSLLSKGPNFREPNTINFKNCELSITAAINDFIAKLKEKYKLINNALDAWKEYIFKSVKNRIKHLRKNNFFYKTSKILNDNDVKAYLSEFHQKFVVVPVDKASNNFSFICKKFYVSKILNEIGIIGVTNPTYKLSNKTKEEIIFENFCFSKKFGLSPDEKDKSLPIMYWTPKMHKSPIGARFIVASKKCSTKLLSKSVSKAFKLIFNQVQSFYDKSHFYSSFKQFWVIENSKPVLDKIQKINLKSNAKNMSTFDFSTLYTKLPHDDLLSVLNIIIDFAFKGGNKNYIDFSKINAFWSNKPKHLNFFTKDSLKRAVQHLIKSCYFEVGNLIVAQTIGIPMGIDPAPFWANLYLSKHECDFISKLIKTDIARAKRFHGTFRFIDDLCALNDGGEFGNSYKEIYPKELELKLEHNGLHATFLDLDLSIENGKISSKIYDKREDFSFFIVRMPNIHSNIPSSIFYGTVLSEILRIARATSSFLNFSKKTAALLTRMENQGGNRRKLVRQIFKAFDNHPLVFGKYNICSTDISRTFQ